MVKQVNVRIDEGLADQLRLRSTLEKRPVNDIITSAIVNYVANNPVPRDRLLEMVDAIVKEDASLLKLLSE